MDTKKCKVCKEVKYIKLFYGKNIKNKFVRFNICKECKEKSRNNKCIYVIGEEGTCYYKIGKTENIRKRLAAIQTDNPRKLYIKYSFITKDNYNLERRLHNLFSNERVNGEWFILTEYDIDKLKNFCTYYNLINID